jgi:cytochrome P450
MVDDDPRPPLPRNDPGVPLAYPVRLPIDFLNLETFRHGHPVWAYEQLRSQAPVYWHEEGYPWGTGFWCVTKYDDVVAISKNPELFSSQLGGHQIDYGDPAKMDPAIKAAITGNMISMDPPLHQVYRKMATPAFTPKALKAMEASIHARVASILDAIAPKGEADFVTEASELLPIYTLADLLGVPEADRPKLLDWTNKLIAAYDPASPYLRDTGLDPETLTNITGMEMFGYGQALFAKKRRCPGHDLMSVMATATAGGTDIPSMHLDGFFMLLVIAGNETTRNTMSGLMHLLSQNPEQYALLRSDRSLLSNAVDEALRLVSPVIHFRRTASADTEIRGQRILKGQKVVMWYGAANRDPDIFPDPERFDIRRPNASRHLAFGIGEHFCLGSVLGKMQIEAMFSAILDRFPDMVAPAAPRYVGSNFISGIPSLPVTFTPTA